MQTKLLAVLDSPRWHCPHCSSDQDLVQAIENGFPILDLDKSKELRFSTDLVHCLHCHEIYIVMPPDAYKRRPKKRAEFPKHISVELTDQHFAKHEQMLDRYFEVKKMFADLEAKAKSDAA